MSRDSTENGFDRRRLLKYLGVGTAGLAGCMGDGDGGDGTTTPDQTTADGTSPGNETTTASGDGPSVGGTFTWGATTEATSLVPTEAADEATFNRFYMIYDGGGVINEDEEFVSRWFESWELSDSNDVVEYQLRDGLQWGNDYGQLTAEDYLYNVENVWQVEENWTGYSYVGDFYVGGEPIQFEETGDLSFRAELPESVPNWIHEDVLLYTVPFPKPFLEQYVEERDYEGLSQDSEALEAQFSGNLGPFSFESWERDSSMRLSRNDDYYLAEQEEEFADTPYFDEFVYQYFSEASTGYSSLESGDLDKMEIEARLVSQFEDTDGIQLWHSQYGTGIFWININHRQNGWAPARESREVRQAFAHLFDKQTLIEEIYQGNANPVDTFHPRWGPYYDDSRIFVPETSVDQAREKLESGTSSDYGYDGDTFVGPDGEQVSLKMVYRSGSQSNETVSEYIQQEFGRAGIDVELDATPWENLLGQYFYNSTEDSEQAFNAGMDATSQEPWDLAYGLGFSHGAYAPWSVIRTTLTPDGGFNTWGYSADDYDVEQACLDAKTADSQEESTEILSELMGFLSEDQPLIWAFNDHSVFGYRDDVAGLPEIENAFSEPEAESRKIYFQQT